MICLQTFGKRIKKEHHWWKEASNVPHIRFARHDEFIVKNTFRRGLVLEQTRRWVYVHGLLGLHCPIRVATFLQTCL